MSITGVRTLARPLIATAVAVLALCMSLVVAPQALAHNVLIKTSPADGSTVAHTPSKVVLTFDNPSIATGTALKITGPSGDVTTGKPVLVNHTVSQAIRPGSPAGKYTVDWRVTSIDGHPVSGTFTFTSKAAGTGTAVSSAPASSPVTQEVGPSTSAVQPDDSSGGTSPWLYVGIVVVLALIAGGVLATRRRTVR